MREEHIARISLITLEESASSPILTLHTLPFISLLSTYPSRFSTAMPPSSEHSLDPTNPARDSLVPSGSLEKTFEDNLRPPMPSLGGRSLRVCRRTDTWADTDARQVHPPRSEMDGGADEADAAGPREKRSRSVRGFKTASSVLRFLITKFSLFV